MEQAKKSTQTKLCAIRSPGTLLPLKSEVASVGEFVFDTNDERDTHTLGAVTLDEGFRECVVRAEEMTCSKPERAEFPFDFPIISALSQRTNR